MSRLSVLVATLALIVAVAVIPTAAQARGSGGPAGDHRGCVSNNGIPLDDGQSVVVDGVTITCNNGTVCHFAAGQFPLCYVSVASAQATTSTGGGRKPIIGSKLHNIAIHRGTALANG